MPSECPTHRPTWEPTVSRPTFRPVADDETTIQPSQPPVQVTVDKDAAQIKGNEEHGHGEQTISKQLILYIIVPNR
eukprot:UN03251